jgi:hypothetical protein
MEKVSRIPYKCVRPRNEGLGYEVQTNNAPIKIVKEDTLTTCELSTSSRSGKEPRVEVARTNQV